MLKLPPVLGGDVAGDYDASRGTGGVFGELRHERGPVLYEPAIVLGRDRRGPLAVDQRYRSRIVGMR